jgi:Flp pilus assembly protein TadD
MNRLKKSGLLLFCFLLVSSTTGCRTRLVASLRKMFSGSPRIEVAAAKSPIVDGRSSSVEGEKPSPTTEHQRLTTIDQRPAPDNERPSEVAAAVAPDPVTAAPAAPVSEIRNPKSEIRNPKAAIKPVVTIDDDAGRNAASGDSITPGQAARYRELLLVKPNDAVVRYNIGRLYLQQGLLEEATREFDMAASLDPQFTYAFIMLGRVLRMRGIHDLALAKLSVAMRLQPDLPVSYIDAGICWDQRGFYDKAREQYLMALRLSPTDPQIHNNIGYSYFLEGEYKEAIKSYQKALDLAPKDLTIHNNIALAHALRKEWSQSLEHFKQAVGEAAAQNNVGHLLLRAGRVDEAIAHLERAVQLDPMSVRALGNLESALRMKGLFTDAERVHAQLQEAEKSATIGQSRTGKPNK